MLQEMLQQISPLDSAAMEAARQHWDAIAKPLHSLGRLEDLVVQLAGITGTANLPPRKKAVLIFCADNGVVAEGVTQTTQAVTAAVTRNFTKGNTTTSSAVFSGLQQLPPEQVTGRGAGLSGAGLRHKVEVIAKAIALHQPDRNDVLDVLSKVGGLDICGMAGAFLGGAVYHVPVLIDGFISAVAANCAVRLVPLCRQYLFASHCSREPAGKLALEALGLRAYLDCDMCLGEGTGGVIGAKLFDFALAAYGEIAGFDAVGIAPYEKLQ